MQSDIVSTPSSSVSKSPLSFVSVFLLIPSLSPLSIHSSYSFGVIFTSPQLTSRPRHSCLKRIFVKNGILKLCHVCHLSVSLQLSPSKGKPQISVFFLKFHLSIKSSPGVRLSGALYLCETEYSPGCC